MTRKYFPLIAVLGIILLVSPAHAKKNDKKLAAPAETAARANLPQLFPYPEAPESMSNLYDRCNYLVSRFWDKCNLSNAFNKPDQLDRAVGDWIAFMPYASVDSTNAAITKLLSRVEKSGPQTVMLAEMVEKHAFTDSSDYYSEFIIYPFAKAAAEHKKTKDPARKHFAGIVKRIDGSRVGNIMEPFKFTTATDSVHPVVDITNLGQLNTDHLLLFFYDPSQIETITARTRLSLDPSVNELINAGVLDIVAVYPGAPDEKWQATTADFPANWLVVASPEVVGNLSFSALPDIYYLNKKHKILAKNVAVDRIVDAFYQLRQALQSQENQPAPKSE